MGRKLHSNRVFPTFGLTLFLIFSTGLQCGVPAGLNFVSIKPLGAVREVSGSAYFFDTDQIDFLVDCGLYYPESKTKNYAEDIRETRQRNTSPPIQPDQIQDILLTHAHLDHIGRIPLMVKKGFKGRIISTPLTKEISMIMFERMILKGTSLGLENFSKSAKSNYLHSQESCIYRKRIKTIQHIEFERHNFYTTDFIMCSECLKIELNEIDSMFEVHNYRRPFKISNAIEVEFFDPKHIPGASSILIKFKIKNDYKTVLISGDVGSGIDNILLGMPDKPSDVDYIFMESTYGGQSREVSENPYTEFLSDLSNALSQGQKVWIPAFVLDRTQKVLNIIRKGEISGILPKNVDVKVVSTSAKRINSVYDNYFTYRPAGLNESKTMSPEKLLPLSPSTVLITPGGIDELDWFYPVVESLVGSSDSKILIVGYQDPRSVVGKLKDSGPGDMLTLKDRRIRLNADVKYHGSAFSGHLDGSGIMEYLKNISINENIILIHGEYEGMLELNKLLGNELHIKAEIPDKDWTLRL